MRSKTYPSGIVIENILDENEERVLDEREDPSYGVYQAKSGWIEMHWEPVRSRNTNTCISRPSYHNNYVYDRSVQK